MLRAAQDASLASASSVAIDLHKLGRWRGIRVLAWHGDDLYACRGYELLRLDSRDIQLGKSSWQPVARFRPIWWRTFTAPNRLSYRLVRDGFHALTVAHDQTDHQTDSEENHLTMIAAVPGAILTGDQAGSEFELTHRVVRGTRPLHITAIPGGNIYWGEYFDNRERAEVHIYASADCGHSWHVAHTFPARVVRHVHNIVYDRYADCLWILTGDEGAECKVLRADRDLRNVEIAISGNQQARAVAAIPCPDALYLATDTPSEKNHVLRLDRAGRIETVAELASSSIFGCQTSCQNANALFFSTMAEPSRVNTNREVHLAGSGDGTNWRVLERWEKDAFPMRYFQYGNVILPDGENRTNYLAATSIAVKGEDLVTTVWEVITNAGRPEPTGRSKNENESQKAESSAEGREPKPMSLASRLNYYRRILPAYLGSGASQLSFWHETPEINPRAFDSTSENAPRSICEEGDSLPRGRVGLGPYYMLFREKADYAGPYDNDGIPVLDYRGAIGQQYNPIAIAQWGLANGNIFFASGDESRRERSLKAANWLVSNLEQNAHDVWVWNHHFDWEYRDRLKAPWYSGLAQGQGISLLLRAHAMTEEEKYLETAERAFVPLTKRVADGGVLFDDEQQSLVNKNLAAKSSSDHSASRDLWIEEYIVDPPTHILNGFIWALWGVFDYWLARGDAKAGQLWDRGVESLIANLGRYDAGYWSLYEQSGTRLQMLASPFYHRLHIVQLRVMAKLTGEAKFTGFAERWEGYEDRRLNRTRALIEKSVYKLLYY